MRSHFEGGTTVYRHDYNGKAFYSIVESQKDMDGKTEYGYINAKFRKGVELDDKTRIDIKDGWLTFYRKGKETVQQVFIKDFEVAKPVTPEVEPEQTYFESVDEELPF